MRFYKDPKTNKAWLLDMQGNKVPLKQQPVVFGNLTIVPVDTVLMSGKQLDARTIVMLAGCCWLD